MCLSNVPAPARPIKCFDPLPPSGRGFQTLLFTLYLLLLPTAQTQLIVETDPQSPFAAIQVWVRAGTVDETPENSGIAHFMEHMVFKGTAGHPRGELDRQVEMRGGLLEATTERDWTRFYTIVPSKEWQPVLRILLQHLKSPAVPAEEMEKERAVILQHEYARHESDPIRRLRYRLYAQAFEGDSYGLPILGNREVLTKLTRADLLNFHRLYYQPSDFIIVLTGNVQEEEAQAVVKEELAGTPAVHDNGIEIKRFKSRQVTLAHEEKADGRVYVGYAIPMPPAQSMEAVLASQLFFELLTAPSLGFLYTRQQPEEEREKPLPFTGLYPEYLPRIRSGLITLIFETNPDQVEALKAHVESAIARIQNLKQSDLDAAQARLRNRHDAESQSPGGRAYQLGLYSMLGLREQAKDYLSLLRKISVADIRQLPHSPTLLSARAPELPNPEVRTSSPESVQRHLLANGVRLIVLPVPGSKAVSVQAFMQSGISEEEGFPAGTGSVLMRLLFGTTQNETSGTLRYRIGTTGGSLTTSWEPQFTRIEINVQPERLESVLSLLAEGLFRADFTREAFLTTRESAIYALNDPREQVFRQAQALAQNALYGNHLYGQPFGGTPESLTRVTLEDVQRFYRTYYTPGNLVIVIAGDVKPERSLTIVRRFFEAMEPADKSRLDSQSPFPKPQPGMKQAKTERPVSYLMAAAALPGMETKRYAAARLLSAVLGEGKGSRLFQNLREAHGIGYEFGSFLVPFRSGILLLAYIQCGAGDPPEAFQHAQDLLQAQLKSLAEKPPTEQELNRAKRFVQFQYELEGQPLSMRAYRLGFWESLRIGYEQADSLPTQIETVTAQQVQEMAKECLLSVGMGVVTK